MSFQKRDIKTVPLGSGRVYLVEHKGETIPTEEALVAMCVPANLAGESKGGSTISYSVSTHKESDDHGVLTREVATEEDVKMKFGLFSWCLESMQRLIRTGRIVQTSSNRFNVLKIGGLDNDDGKQYIVIFKHTDKKYSPLYAAMIGANGAGLTIPFARDSVSKLEPEFTAVPCEDEGTLIKIFEDLGEPAESEPEPEAGETPDGE